MVKRKNIILSSRLFLWMLVLSFSVADLTVVLMLKASIVLNFTKAIILANLILVAIVFKTEFLIRKTEESSRFDLWFFLTLTCTQICLVSVTYVSESKDIGSFYNIIWLQLFFFHGFLILCLMVKFTSNCSNEIKYPDIADEETLSKDVKLEPQAYTAISVMSNF